jgi:hypothetical protein
MTAPSSRGRRDVQMLEKVLSVAEGIAACTLNLENEKYSIRKLNLSIGGSTFMGNCFVLNITISFLGNKKLKERKRKIK